MKSRPPILTSVVCAAAALAVGTATADWTVDWPPISAGVPQDVVVTYKLNPMSEPEAACIAVTLARALRGDFSMPTGANVSLFPTLDGVALGDRHVVKRARFHCNTPEGEITLQENLEDFLSVSGDRANNDLDDNNMVVCPLCWMERYGDEAPDYGVLDSMAVGAVLLNAEKIFDF